MGGRTGRRPVGLRGARPGGPRCPRVGAGRLQSLRGAPEWGDGVRRAQTQTLLSYPVCSHTAFTLLQRDLWKMQPPTHMRYQASLWRLNCTADVRRRGSFRNCLHTLAGA